MVEVPVIVGSSRLSGVIPVIVGSTGSGKTGVAIEVAREVGRLMGLPEGEVGGEVISADSRAIYKYMDIGTAKPSREDGAVVGRFYDGLVTHWGVDLVEPGERFTVADWKEYAERKIAEIEGRGHLPIVAGGTGLYVDALVFDYQFGKGEGEGGGKKLQEESGSRGKNLQEGSESRGKNLQHRNIEPVDREEMSPKYKVYGIKWEMDELRERLRQRAEGMFNEKLYAETEFLVKKYGWGSQAMKSNIYQFAWEYVEGKCAREEAVARAMYDDYHLAKRQMTWFKRNKEIVWLPLGEVKDAVLSDIEKKL